MTQIRTTVATAAPQVTISSVRGKSMVPSLFGVTAFLGAALLFVVQPMVAKLLLPSYGGSATVWSTSSLFFQVLLLAAYWYVHLTTQRLGSRGQPRLHLAVLLLPALALPVALPADAAPLDGASPTLWLLRTLVLMIALPFAVVATTGPVLQRWYSWSGQARSHDPYFLFAASNLGSFGGLLAYPLVIEPHVPLADQRTLWSWGFGIFAVMVAACAITVRRHQPGNVGHNRVRSLACLISPRRRLYWMALGFLPSSLMLGATAHISTDVAAIPLLWVVPLGVYLATFVAAFGSTSRTIPHTVTRLAVAAAFVGLLSTLRPGSLHVGSLVGLHLLVLALVGYAAHRRLSCDRPNAEYLTTFYLAVALGGALGGLLNGLVAPVLFDRVFEYQLALLAVPLLLVGRGSAQSGWLLRHHHANRVRGSIAAVTLMAVSLGLWWAVGRLPERPLFALVVTAWVMSVAWFLTAVPSSVIVAGLAVSLVTAGVSQTTALEQSRSFFGSYVVRESDGLRTMAHGTTVHGSQFRAVHKRGVPTSYYSREGPLGDLFRTFGSGRFTDIAAVGLGTGTLAAYGHSGQHLTFFEIDPDVVEMARDPRLFSYLADSEAEIETVVGDGRLRVAEFGEEYFDVLILDAFSSDSIPVHLLTEEAMEIYASRLVHDGVLMVHVSNRVFDLEPVMAAAAGHLGWEAVIGRGTGRGEGAKPSVWVMLTSDEEAAGELLSLPDWTSVNRDEVVRWTDDYSSILAVLR